MEMKAIDGCFSICKLEDFSKVRFGDDFCFLAKTDEENSLVCRTDSVPENAVVRDDGWRAFRIQGVLDFSLIGILSRISALMAGNGIGIFAVSTYNTDYVLVKEGDFERALEVLRGDGCLIV